MSILGSRIKSLREKNGISQKRLAESLGITNVQLSRYETGDRNPDPEMIKKIAETLDTTTDYLLGLADSPSSTHKDDRINLAFYNYDGLTEEEKDYLDMQLEIFRKMKQKKEKK
jgi:transcriptional regulator with XRE-family HTH domain